MQSAILATTTMSPRSADSMKHLRPAEGLEPRVAARDRHDGAIRYGTVRDALRPSPLGAPRVMLTPGSGDARK